MTGAASPGAVDVAIVGGGLAGGLIALALARRRPEIRVALIEAGPTCGGNHIWSFFTGDVAERDRWLVAPLVCHGWPDHEVRFEGYARTLPAAYHSIESSRLDALLRQALPPERLVTGMAAEILSPTCLRLADGQEMTAGAIIDARGAGDMTALDLGWQKFVGQTLALHAPHGLARPIIMDARVDQRDGYRFVYVLPTGPCTVFVEDTYYSTDPALDVPMLERRIADYAAGQGWQVAAVTHRETGVLPVCMGGDMDRYWLAGGDGIAKAGMRGGFFHAMTGYSLPDAVRIAAMIAAMPDLTGSALPRALRRAASAHWRDQAFYRMLATLLFRAAEPAERHRILARFYRLPVPLIERFYAGASTRYDRLRVLAGRPPVPVARAIAALGARQG